MSQLICGKSNVQQRYRNPHCVVSLLKTGWIFKEKKSKYDMTNFTKITVLKGEYARWDLKSSVRMEVGSTV